MCSSDLYGGKGTYIRAIARDIGEKLGCGAHVEALRRMSVGPFHVSDACVFTSESRHHVCDLASRLRSPRDVIGSFQRIALTEEAERRLRDGHDIAMAEAGRYVPGELALENGLFAEGGRILSFVDVTERQGVTYLIPQSNILMEEGSGAE